MTESVTIELPGLSTLSQSPPLTPSPNLLLQSQQGETGEQPSGARHLAKRSRPRPLYALGPAIVGQPLAEIFSMCASEAGRQVSLQAEARASPIEHGGGIAPLFLIFALIPDALINHLVGDRR